MRKIGGGLFLLEIFKVSMEVLFFLGKNIQWITVPCMSPSKEKKKKSSKGMSRGHLPGTTVNWDLVNRGILQTSLKLNPEPHLSACLSARSEALNKYSLKCYVPIKSLLSNRFHPLKRPENSGTLPVWLITHFLQMQNLAVLWNEEGSELRLIIHTFL